MSLAFETDRLSEQVVAKHDLLTQLRDLGCRQLELIEAGDLSQLFKVLSAKQRLINALQEVERGMTSFRDQDPEQRIWRSPADRQNCQAASRRCETLLVEILQQERQSELQLTRRRDAAAEQLQGLHHAEASRVAYDGGAGDWTGQVDYSTEN